MTVVAVKLFVLFVICFHDLLVNTSQVKLEREPISIACIFD